jgi:hypothetical protein
MIGRETLQCRRVEPGSYIDGEYHEGQCTTIEIMASVQPVVGDELVMLPEGRRDRQTYKLYTKTELYGVSLQQSRNPDTVIIADEEYEVFEVQSWRNNIINHYKVIVQRI